MAWVLAWVVAVLMLTVYSFRRREI
jgi:hypothetical protein